MNREPKSMLFLVIDLNLCKPFWLNFHVSFFGLSLGSVISKPKSMKIENWSVCKLLNLWCFYFIVLKREEDLLLSISTFYIYLIISCNIMAQSSIEGLVLFLNCVNMPEHIDGLFNSIKEYFSMTSIINLSFGAVWWWWWIISAERLTNKKW